MALSKICSSDIEALSSQALIVRIDESLASLLTVSHDAFVPGCLGLWTGAANLASRHLFGCGTLGQCVLGWSRATATHREKYSFKPENRDDRSTNTGRGQEL